jgi:hypothetical protein
LRGLFHQYTIHHLLLPPPNEGLHPYRDYKHRMHKWWRIGKQMQKQQRAMPWIFMI